MKKLIHALEIEIEGDSVFLSQPNFGNDDDCISIKYDQIEIVINWLIDAKEEIERETFESKKGKEKNA